MNMAVAKLPFRKELAYAAGMMGWSMMTNMVIVMLPYFYLPPSNAGLITLVPQLLLIGSLNLLSVIVASGRLVDAVYDPFIASRSDKSRNPKGRRIPFMKWAAAPSVIFCCLVFFPPVRHASVHNAIWLAGMLVGFFMSATTYIIPYNALLPEMARTGKDKVKLSSFQQVGFVAGIVVSGCVNNLADLVQKAGHIGSRNTAVEYTIWGLCILAGVIMLIPVWTIDEKKYAAGKPSHLNLWPAVRKTFANRNFIYYLTSDFSYYMALSIISSGILYFVTVLLRLPESDGGMIMGAMVLVSLLFYPLVGTLAHKFGKKPVVLFSFSLLSLIFIAIYFLGRFPLSPKAQIYTLAVCAAFPLASLGILPNAILSEIAQADTKETGENREGMFFAVKYLFVKIGQTLGISLFAFLTVYGKDPGHDQGLRLNGVCGFVLCVLAVVFFSRFKEERVQRVVRSKKASTA
jgi:glycoside/pentoside/hexuronide:cation symporter, GPH family